MHEFAPDERNERRILIFLVGDSRGAR